ncbi:MAG: hypothetical protein ACYDD1_18735 [Caulobacteraceae bacterium]
MTLRYAIISCDGEWRVLSERRRIGHFLDCDAATMAGARLALEAINEGHEVEFLVQDETAELRRRDPVACTAVADAEIA